MIPVFSISLKIPFQEASMQYCCLVVSGDRGSEGGGGRSMASWLKSDAASFVSLQPIVNPTSDWELENLLVDF